MYSEGDRASTKRIVVTFSAIALGTIVLGAVASAWLGAALGPEPAPEQAAVEETATAEPTSTPETTPATEVPAAAVASIAATMVAPDVKPEPAPQAPKTSSAVVVIDAGHQKKGDSSLEPVGPGATEKKPKVAGGTRGTATGNPEGEITLEVAKRLREELEARGVTVIMVRTKQDVNIANSKRAKIANDADADLFIRLHCDGAGSSSTHGLSTLIPGKNEWTGPIVADSKVAGHYVHDAVIKSTGANDRGVKSRTDLAGFNWSKVPTILVEMGFMTNATEDRKLASAEYQKKLAVGMANGTMRYLESQ